MTLNELTKKAVDLMSSQQAMPDQGALDQLADVVRQAYRLGLRHARELNEGTA